jgi:heptosyltransferase I
LRYDLRRLAWLLDGADVLLAPDTGPLHIAVALGTPSIGMYGFTDPRRDGPYGRFEDLVLDRYPRTDVGRPPRRARARAMERIEEVHVVEKLEAARERYLTNV